MLSDQAKLLDEALRSAERGLLPYASELLPAIRDHLVELLTDIWSLRPHVVEHRRPDGSTTHVLVVRGTLPAWYEGSLYHLPVDAWLPEGYPRCAPILYVVPTPSMVVPPGHPSVEASGRVRTAYLRSWAYPKSTLHGAAVDAAVAFGQEPPLLAKPPGWDDARCAAAVEAWAARWAAPEPAPPRAAPRAREGAPARRWYVVFNRRSATSQRVHAGVSSADVEPLVSAGCADGLRVSAAACAGDRWAFVLERRAEIVGQVHVQTSDGFPSEWVHAWWKKNYYITSVAGSDSGGFFVVMSLGTRYSHQMYWTNDSFPSRWISTARLGRYSVTAMATAGPTWAVVVSRRAGVARQSLEVDGRYPAEGVRRRHGDGFRVAAIAATTKECAVVMTVPKRGKARFEQEVLEATGFPTDAIAERRTRNLYVSCMACAISPEPDE